MENIEEKINQETKIELSPSRLAVRLLEILPKRSGNKILEIGAKEADAKGEHIGDDCVYFAKEGNLVTLIEDGEGVMERIREKAEKQKIDSNIELINGKFGKINLPDEMYDAAFSLCGLDNTYLPRSFKEISRTMKPSAKALVFIYYKSGGKLIQGPEEKLEEYITQSGLQIDSKFIRTIDQEKGLEAIIFEMRK